MCAPSIIKHHTHQNAQKRKLLLKLYLLSEERLNKRGEMLALRGAMVAGITIKIGIAFLTARDIPDIAVRTK